jgi:SOS-response transcriptional repressor LexA
MMPIAENLQKLLDNRRMNATQLALVTKVPQPTIHRILSGEHESPRDKTIEPLAAYFRISVKELRYGAPDILVKNDSNTVSMIEAKLTNVADAEGKSNLSVGPNKQGSVPLISWVQAGDWANVVDNFSPGDAEEWVDTTVPIRKHTFALRVNGPSMENPNGSPSFPHGCIIIVEPDIEALPNHFVVARQGFDEEVTFKRLVRDGGRQFLQPLNPAFPTMELRDDAVICGVVREMVMRFF